MTCTSRCSTYKITRGLNRLHCQIYQGNDWWELELGSPHSGWLLCGIVSSAVLYSGQSYQREQQWTQRGCGEIYTDQTEVTEPLCAGKHKPNRDSESSSDFLLWYQLNKGTCGQWAASRFHEVLWKHQSPLRRLCFHSCLFIYCIRLGGGMGHGPEENPVHVGLFQGWSQALFLFLRHFHITECHSSYHNAKLHFKH